MVNEYIKDVRAIWITNIVTVKDKSMAIAEIARRSDVSSIVLDKPSFAMGANT